MKLQNQPLQVLALLVQRAPDIVSRDEIRLRVWGDNVYIDIERNINFCIRQIRGVLHNASAPHFIETLPREGYRFIAPFMRRRTDSKSDVILMSSIGGPERVLQRVTIGPLIAAFGRRIAWSPDGKWLCFTSEVVSSSRQALFLLRLDSGAVRPLFARFVSGSNDTSPAFSPDGQWLAFGCSSSPATRKILFQRLTEELEPTGEPAAVQNTFGTATTPVWLPDSEHVLLLDGAGTRISQAKIRGSAKLVYSAGAQLSGLTLDRSGTHLLASRAAESADIESLPLQGLKVAGAVQRLVYSTASESQPRFSPEGRQLAFTSNRSGASEIWLGDADGQNPRQLTHIGAYIAGYPK